MWYFDIVYSSIWETCKPSTQGAPVVNIPASARLEVTLREVAEGLRHEHDKGIGVDCEDVANIDIDNLNFIERNFTQNEIDYCRRSKTVPEVSLSEGGRDGKQQRAFANQATGPVQVHRQVGS